MPLWSQGAGSYPAREGEAGSPDEVRATVGRGNDRFPLQRELVWKPKTFYFIVYCYTSIFNDINRFHIHTVEVTGSNPVPPTRYFKGLQRLKAASPFFCRFPVILVKTEIPLTLNQIALFFVISISYGAKRRPCCFL